MKLIGAMSMRYRTIQHVTLCALLILLGQLRPASAGALLKTQYWVTNGIVVGLAHVDNTIYLGGSFTAVGPETGSFAVLDSDTAAVNLTLPKVTGTVYATVSDGSGGWYLGGDFARVGDVTRSNLAHILAD